MRGLKNLLQPGSVAVIGASEKPDSLGSHVIANLQAGAYAGPVLPVHPRYQSVQRILSYKTVEDMPIVPDLAILCTPAGPTPDIVARLGARGTGAAIVMTEDLDGSAPDTTFKRSLMAAALPHGIRLLGPGSIGLQVPGQGLNASWIPAMPGKGTLALISQSGSVAASVVGWAARRHLGFSHVVTLGDSVDVSVADLLDHLAADGNTRAILLYLDAFPASRAFLSAARATARIKPILVIKPKGIEAEPQAGQPWIPADEIHDAAFRRAGMLRIGETAEWFDAVEALGYGRRESARRLVIVSNGAGPGDLAAAQANNRLCGLAPETLAELAKLLPVRRAVGNPADLGRDATPERYAEALRLVLGDPSAPAALAILASSLVATPELFAKVVAEAAQQSKRHIIACILGWANTGEARRTLAEAQVPLFETPEAATRAFFHQMRYRRAQNALMQLPSFQPKRSPGNDALKTHDEAEGAAILRAYGTLVRAVMEDRPFLDEAEGVRVLNAYGVPAIPSGEGAEVNALPLTVWVVNDLAVGRAIVLSIAGRRTVALPPLNTVLAQAAAADVLPSVETALGRRIDPDLVVELLVRVADLVVELPEIRTMEIGGFLIRDGELVAAGVRLGVGAPDSGTTHLTILPYPARLEERIVLRDGRPALLRPLRLDDIGLYQAMLARIAPDDIFLRFCTRFGGDANTMPTDLLAKLIHLDYDREMTFIALAAGKGGQPEALGVVDAISTWDPAEAEFSVIVRSDLKGAGLGKVLMNKIIDYTREKGRERLMGVVLRKNTGMRGLATRLGFTTDDDPDDDMVTVRLSL
jgi:acetyltransferase